MHVNAKSTTLKISLSIIIFVSPFWPFKYGIYFLNVNYHLHVLIEILVVSSSLKHQDLSRPGITFCFINIPDKCLNNGGPWRIIYLLTLALNGWESWLRVPVAELPRIELTILIGWIATIAWLSVVPVCFISPLGSGSTGVQSVFTLLRKSLSWTKVTWIRFTSHICTIRSSIIPSVSVHVLQRIFPLEFYNQNFIFSSLA
jgi:hypothetical protein